MFLFTDSDLDGISCVLIGKQFFNKIDYKISNPREINEHIQTFLKDEKRFEYDKIFITDLSLDKETEELLNKHKDEFKHIQLIDHHNVEMNSDWALIKQSSYRSSEKRNIKESATSLFLQYLLRNRDMVHYKNLSKKKTNCLKEYAELVRRYDTWEFNEIYKDDEPLRLNEFFHSLTYKDYIEEVHQILSGSSCFKLSRKHNYLLDNKIKKRDDYIDRKLKKVKEFDFEGYKAGFVVAEEHISLLGNKISSLEGIDIACILIPDYNSISLRTTRDDIDLSIIAKKYGGGGHPKASGFPLKEKIDYISYFIK